jgi:tetratricopeptide (TPR) repeat protein
MKKFKYLIVCIVLFCCMLPGDLRLDLLFKKCDQCNDEIISSILKYQSVFPYDWQFNFCLGKCYYQKHNYDMAVKNFQIAIAKNVKKEKLIQKELIKVYKQAGDDFYSQAQLDSAAYYYRQLFLIYKIPE